MTQVAEAPLELVECPVFDKLDRVAMAFACELTSDIGRTQPAIGFRLADIYRELFGPPGERRTSVPSDATVQQGRKLFEASRSFLDDITTGPPGVNGRPLMLSAEIGQDGNSGLAATIIRPENWRYEYESTEVRLTVPEAGRKVPVRFNDHFCIFESGRIFYLAIFGQEQAMVPRLDEYGLIQLERLTLDPEAACASKFLAFRIDPPGAAIPPPAAVSLREFLDRRLAYLATAASDQPNAVRDVLRPFGIVGEHDALQLLRRDWLKNGLLQVEDVELLSVARYADENFSLEDPSAKAAPSLAGMRRKLKKADGQWRDRHLDVPVGGPQPHHATSFEGGEETKIFRHLLAFAGLAQGIPDFPRQDESEIHDSTRPATAALEGMFYVHPAFELAIGINWRTFSDAQRNVGGCPYAIMAWVVGLHDEVIVTDMERRIERMIYDSPPEHGDGQALGRANPAGDLMTIMQRVASYLPFRRAMMDDNLRARLNIFRWCSIQRSGNVFRYPTERELLDAIRTSRGTDARFDDAHAMIDRYENLVEDLSGLAANYSSARTNWLLAAITFLSVVGLPKSLVEAGSLFGWTVNPVWATVVVLATIAALFALWNGLRARTDRPPA